MTVAQTPIEHCMDLVRTEDHLRFQTVLFARSEVRDHLMALHAFNHEIAKTRETVSEPMIGEIRLQWWREAIDGVLEGTPREHPVVLGLSDISGIENLKDDLIAVIDARASDLYAEGPKNIGALEAYIDGCGGALGAATAKTLAGEGCSDETLTVGRAAGRAFAMAGMLKALAWAFASGRQVLPEAELGASGVAPNMQLTPEHAQAMAPVIEQMTAIGVEDCKIVGSASRQARKIATPLVLQARYAQRIFKQIQTLNFDPFALADQKDRPIRTILDMVFGSVSLRV